MRSLGGVNRMFGSVRGRANREPSPISAMLPSFFLHSLPIYLGIPLLNGAQLLPTHPQKARLQRQKKMHRGALYVFILSQQAD
jgi:hypothetical protein